MANIVKVYLDPHKNTYCEMTWNQQQGTVQGRAMEYYRVQLDGKVSDPSFFFAATDGTTTIPSVGDPYAPNPQTGLRVMRVYPEKDPQSPIHYNVQVEYSTLVPQFFQSSQWDIQLGVTSEVVTETVYHDFNNRPILNSACDTFENQPTQDYYIEVITASYKTKTIDINQAESWAGHLNTNALSININGYTKTCEAQSLKLSPPHIRSVPVPGGISYWQVDIEMRYLPPKIAPQGASDAGQSVSGWKRYFPDLGYQAFSANCGKGTILSDGTISCDGSKAQAVNKPQFLDGSGNLLSGTGPGTTTPCSQSNSGSDDGGASSSAVYLEFALDQTADFSSIIPSNPSGYQTFGGGPLITSGGS